MIILYSCAAGLELPVKKAEGQTTRIAYSFLKVSSALGMYQRRFTLQGEWITH